MSSRPRRYSDDEREIAYLNGIIASLERQIELLRKRCGDYARQRRAAVDVPSAYGSMSISETLRERQSGNIDVGVTLPVDGSHLETAWSDRGYWLIDEVNKDRTMFTSVGRVWRQEDAETICRIVNRYVRERDEWGGGR